VDMLAMTYMFLPMSDWVPVVTGILIGYLVLQCVAWAGNLWAHLPLYVRGSPAADTAVAGDAPGAASAHAFTPRVGLTGITDGSVRATLAVMAAGMAYMLLAM